MKLLEESAVRGWGGGEAARGVCSMVDDVIARDGYRRDSEKTWRHRIYLRSLQETSDIIRGHRKPRSWLQILISKSGINVQHASHVDVLHAARVPYNTNIKKNHL